MKRTLLFITCMLASLTMSAQDGLTVEDIQNSGCLSRTRGYMDEWIPAIVLKKEGSILSVEVQNFISNCATSDFVVNFSLSEGNNGEPCTLSAEVLPVYSELQADCLCPYNVSFTVRDFEVNTFFLDCGWYKGLVELKDGEPLVLKEREYYESLLSESKVWTMLYKAVVNPEVYGDVYYLKETKLVGDTIINDIPFMQKYNREWKLGEKKPAEWSATDEYLGQNGGKVYIYSNRNKMMVEDMDMSLNVGDKTTSYYCYDEDKELPYCFVATAVSDTILYNADVIKPRKCTHVLLEDFPSETDIWIDGVGSVSLGIDGMGMIDATGAIPKLYKVTDGDAVIYHDEVDVSTHGIADSLYGEWLLMGWNDGGTWVEVDKKKVRNHCLSIEFKDNGNLMAYSMVNDIYFGQLTLKGNELHFDGDGVWSTMVYRDEMENIFFEEHIKSIKSYRLDGKRLRLYYTDNDYFVFTKDLNDNEEQSEYRPFVEDGKVWKVGDVTSGSPVQLVDYYYFDGDTIVDGKTCKQMMRQRYVSPDYAKTHNLSQDNIYVGAWYEEDKKVYFSDANSEQLTLMYDFSVDANDTIEINNMSYVIGPKQTGDKEGFKGVYRNVRLWEDGVSYYSVPWLEGVGGTDRPTTSVYPGVVDPLWFLMECYVDDEVIYFNGAEDGATPAGARKQRIDFTHTPKIKPKTREGSEENQSLYGEYNEQRLSINLDPINDAYTVCITDDSGKVVYEKPINAGNIVGLNIDISAYSEGCYIVTVDNSNESFTGEFNVITTGIEEVKSQKSEARGFIYNLQGQRLSSLQKGLNIVNGQKVYVK